MKIVIVGNGTAAWSTAAALSYNKHLDITIIATESIPSIGVGESTLPMINDFHKEFAIFADLQWALRAQGTMKFTIEFENFLSSPSSAWSHPLSSHKEYETFMTIKNLPSSNAVITDKFFYTKKLKNSGFCKLAPIGEGAYHLNASLYAQELRHVALLRGVKLYSQRVCDIHQNGTHTHALIVEDNTKVEGDLFIDCTGFHRFLFKHLPSEFISFSDRLFCNSAAVVHLPYRHETQQKINATLGYGLENGWVWHIPLENTISYGYVFSQTHASDEYAMHELKEYLSQRYGYDKEAIQPKIVRFESGAYNNTWVGNTIAIGLSSFFIEPIESTGIALFQIQIRELAAILQKYPSVTENLREKYNKTVSTMITSVKNFVEMHYICSNRRDTPFWREASGIKPHEWQQEMRQLYQNGDYKKIINHDIGGIFSSLSWLLLLIGYDETKNIN